MRITRINQLPWKPEGMILDPYSGSRCWWKGTTANVVFVDRYFVLPGGIQASVVSLPFVDGTFDQVWADPPHLIRKSPFKTSSVFGGKLGQGRFGAYPTRDVVHDEWTKASQELWRVTKPDAVLVWKSIDGAKTVSQCVNNGDLACLEACWKLEEELRFPSVISWSTATTVYTRWSRR